MSSILTKIFRSEDNIALAGARAAKEDFVKVEREGRSSSSTFDNVKSMDSSWYRSKRIGGALRALWIRPGGHFPLFKAYFFLRFRDCKEKNDFYLPARVLQPPARIDLQACPRFPNSTLDDQGWPIGFTRARHARFECAIRFFAAVPSVKGCSTYIINLTLRPQMYELPLQDIFQVLTR